MYASTISKEDINHLPLQRFEGKIHVITTAETTARAVKKILQYDVVGFDTETKPTFKKGEVNEVALIQVALPDEAFLFRVNITGITDELHAFLETEKVTKIGVALRDDLKDLNRLRKFKPGKFLELNHLVTDIGIESNGLRKLTAIILGYRISKNAQVSNWENARLTQKQIDYAATDAWVCIEMYNKLLQKGFL